MKSPRKIAVNRKRGVEGKEKDREGVVGSEKKDRNDTFWLGGTFGFLTVKRYKSKSKGGGRRRRGVRGC